MGDLIPTRLRLDDTVRSKLRCSVTNISEWLQAFAVYVSVIAKKQPHCVPDLMGYQILILEASNEYRNDCWLGYDRHFWQQAASWSICKWSDMDSTLWNMAFTGQARTGRCGYCFSLFHTSKDCELASDGGVNVEPQYLRSRRTVLRPYRLICRHWNEEVLQTVPSQIVVLSTFALCVHSILRIPMFITRQFIVLTASTKAEAGHLLRGSHNLHHYSPKAASPDHHFQACPDNSKYEAQIYQYCYDYLYTPPTLPHTSILNSVHIYNYILC